MCVCVCVSGAMWNGILAMIIVVRRGPASPGIIAKAF